MKKQIVILVTIGNIVFEIAQGCYIIGMGIKICLNVMKYFVERKIKDRIGVPWAITSDIDFKIIKQFIKTSREFMLDLQKKYDVLYNYTSDSNIKSHKWLKSLGFEIKYDKTFTADTGKRFIYFEWRKKYV